MNNSCKKGAVRAVGLTLALFASASLMAQEGPKLAAYWDFNDNSNPGRTLDKLYGFEGLLEGGAFFESFTPTMAPGDFSVDFGTHANGALVRVNQVPFLNMAAAQDQITISFWQVTSVAASSAFWGISPSSSDGQRGIQAHTPWSDGNIYYDTAGCCAAGAQRISGNVVTAHPNFGDNNTWFHLAFVKDGPLKQIWVNGTLFLEGGGALPLPSDFTGLILGANNAGGNSMAGAIDDFAVFVGALSPANIAQLAAGTKPDQLTGVPVMTGPIVSGAVGNPLGFTVTITDSSANAVAPATVSVQFDGSPVTPTVNKVGNLTTVTYTNPANLLAVGSSHEVNLAFKDTAGNDFDAVRSFVMGPYVAVPPEFALAPGSGNAAQPGFIWNVHQNEALQETTVQRGLDQLAGRRIDSVTGQPYANLADPAAQGVATAVSSAPNPAWAPIRFDIATVINLSQTADENNGNFPNDGQMPGIPGTTLSTDGIAAELLTYIEFTQSGVYVMGVNSDDGFRTTVSARSPKDATGLMLGQFDAGRGAADTLFTFYIAEAGVYPFKTVWFEGGGGANIEWFTVASNGTKVLLNDSANSGLATFRAATGAGVYVTSTVPSANQIGVRPDTMIEVQLMDDGGATVDQGSIQLLLDGVALSPTISKAGAITTVRATSTWFLAPLSSHQVEVRFAAVGGPLLSGTWPFTVANYLTLPEWIARPVGSGTNPGMVAKVHQMNMPDGTTTRANRWHIADQQAEGFFGENFANVTGPVNISVVNMNQEPVGIGIFQPDDDIPGIPGRAVATTDNIAMAVVSYLELAGGLHEMGVNSDDGFRVIAREMPQRWPLEIESPASVAGPIGSVSGGPESGGGAGALPRDGVIRAEVVATDPYLADGDLVNAAALAGKIALISRGAVAFDSKIQRAVAAGAVGVIMVNNAAPDAAGGPYPIVMGGITTAAVPAVMIMLSDGDRIKAQLDAGQTVVATLGMDPTPTLGEFNDGRGQNNFGTRFFFRAPKAGVYPFRLTWFEGGGGANVEWFTVHDGTPVLVNDLTDSLAIRAFRNAPAVVEPTEAEFAVPGLNPDNTVTLNWSGDGTLQEAEAINGPWNPSPNQAKGQQVTPTGAGKYYRIWVQ